MVVLLVIAGVVILLLVLKSPSKARPATGSAGALPGVSSGWVIGPVVRGVNHSIGMPDRPSITQGDGWMIQFPGALGKVDYVQNFNPPVLQAGKKLVMRFVVTGGGFVAYEFPDRQALVSLQFQRRGDNWSGTGIMQSYRWYSRQMIPLVAGEFTLTVPLVLDSWGDVQGQSDNQAAFDDALGDLANLAVVFGHSSGAGHGVYASQPSTFTLLGITQEG